MSYEDGIRVAELKVKSIRFSNIKEEMKKRGWDVPLCQRPIAMHYSFTPLNSTKVDKMIADFEGLAAARERVSR